MCVLGKWFGFDYGEVLDVAIALYDRREYNEAAEAFDTIVRNSDDDWLVLVATSYVGQCRNRQDPVKQIRPYIV